MKEHITLQTAAAFERIKEALLGRTDDDLSVLVEHLNQLLNKASQIEEVSAEMNHDID
jgi:hypothetical protein